MMRLFVPLIAAISTAACASIPLPGSPRALAGSFGGNHVALELTSLGGTLSYDCAAGTIGPIVPDRAGHFAANGLHMPGHGGPVRVDEVPLRKAAHYSGTVSGDRITLAGVLDDGTRLGPFLMVRGAQPMLMRCL